MPLSSRFQSPPPPPARRLRHSIPLRPKRLRLRLRLRLLSLPLLLLAFVRAAAGHGMIAWPPSISGVNKCSNVFDCRGGHMCPRFGLRLDVNPLNPPIVVQRGQKVLVNILRNNHVHGFARYSLVPVSLMHSRSAHDRGVFYIGCNDANVKDCQKWNKPRDCTFDHSDRYYQHQVVTPTHVDDGVYVLAWTWYGSAFEDFRDCTYIHIKGGRKTSSFRPIFNPKGSSTSEDPKSCLATVDKTNICSYSTCSWNGIHKLRQRVPVQFKNGKKPRKLYRKAFKPFRPKRASVKISGMGVVLARRPSSRKYWSTGQGKSVKPKRLCMRRFFPAILVKASGSPIEYVEFYLNHRLYSTVREAPYDMENSPKLKNGRLEPIKFTYNEGWFFVSARVVAKGGSEVWKSLEIVTKGAC